MTKLNWHDASKELPKSCTDCIVIARSFSTDGKIITGTYNAYYSKSSERWLSVDNCHVVAWVYTSELLPAKELITLPEK